MTKHLPPYGVAITKAVARDLIKGEACERLKVVCPDCHEPWDACTCPKVTYKDRNAVYDLWKGARK